MLVHPSAELKFTTDKITFFLIGRRQTINFGYLNAYIHGYLINVQQVQTYCVTSLWSTVWFHTMA